MPQPPGVQAIADPLIESYRTAWERVLAEQESILEDPTQWRKARRLREMSNTIGSIMKELDGEAADWVAQQYPKIYGAGLVDGAAAAGESALWSTIHQEAVEQLAYGVYNDLLSATSHVNDTTKDLIRTLARAEGTTALIAGDTAQAAGRKLEKELLKNGISAVTYKNGAKHGLAEYAEMNLRTTTALGYNNGTLNASPTTVFWECFDGPGCGWSFHEDTEQALGKIVTRDEALGYPISHPNCRRSFGPRPDLNSTASAKEKLGSVKPSQVEAQRVQDTERLAKQGRAGRTSRTPRTSRSARSTRQTQQPSFIQSAEREFSQNWSQRADQMGSPMDLTPDERHFVDRYRGQGFDEINESLRQGIPNENAARLSEILGRSTINENVSVWRGAGDHTETLLEMHARGELVGSTITEKAFTSTSFDPFQHRYFSHTRREVIDGERSRVDTVLRLDVPAGTRGGMPLRDSVENEVLFQPGLRYQVTGVVRSATDIEGRFQDTIIARVVS